MLGRKKKSTQDHAQWHRTRGNALLGGSWLQSSPVNYTLSYARAARVLFDEAIRTDELSELAMPCFFLQRHAFELALKDLLGMVAGIQNRACELQRARGESVTAPPFEAADQERLSSTHTLDVLLGLLDKHLPRIGMPAVRPGWKKLASSFEAFELSKADRSRYETVRPSKEAARKQKRGVAARSTHEASFPRQRPVRLRYLLRRLEKFIHEAFEDEHEPSLGRSLYYIGNDQIHELYSLREL